MNLQQTNLSDFTLNFILENVTLQARAAVNFNSQQQLGNPYAQSPTSRYDVGFSEFWNIEKLELQ